MSKTFWTSKISFVCTQMVSIHHILWYNLVSLSLKKDRTSSRLMFSNRSLKLFTLKNRFLMRAKFLHSMRTLCLLKSRKHKLSCYSRNHFLWTNTQYFFCTMAYIHLSCLEYRLALIVQPSRTNSLLDQMKDITLCSKLACCVKYCKTFWLILII